ncbi:hypothetical protein [Amycolatopsis sp. NBRC 101858]|uniref:hypothetical protein n=1 Tax=Amycolatopsis sp. NBRC 101858 TaxID=3032200 RepID=UPI002555FCA2|nr:hypothetical protein [Amycolatopsis sp. NBRC 101858]
MEPGAGEPLEFPAEFAPPAVGAAGPLVPGEAGLPANPLASPATAAPADPPVPVEAAANPLAIPATAAPAVPANPLAFPAEVTPPAVGAATPLVPAEPASPLAFPAEVTSSAGGSPVPVEPTNPLAFPSEVATPAGAPTLPAEAAPANPLAFPAAAAPADPLAFPEQAASASHPAEQLPFPVAELPGAVTPIPPPAPAAAPAPIPATEAAAAPSGLPRFLAPALTAVAALMAVGGLFLPLFRLQQHINIRQGFFEAQLTVTETAWASRTEIPGQEVTEQGAPPVGIPLIFAVLVLAVAAFTAYSRPDRGLGRWLIAAGAFFTAGVVSTAGMTGPGWASMADGLDLDVVTGAGMWLLIGATALAAVAAVLAYLPARRRTLGTWADPALAYADTPTPPSGVAITVLPPEPDEKHD